MIDRALAARLLSPAGLILAGVGLLLPFGAVSCTVAPGASAALTYTGTDLIGKTGGTLSTTRQFAQIIGPADAAGPNAGTSLLNEADTTGLRTLLVAVAGLMLIGVISTVLQPRLMRITVAAATAYAALVTLIGAQVVGIPSSVGSRRTRRSSARTSPARRFPISLPSDRESVSGYRWCC